MCSMAGILKLENMWRSSRDRNMAPVFGEKNKLRALL